MGRKPNAPKAARRARDNHQFGEAYHGLDEAAVLLRERGDIEVIERAIGQLEADAQSRPLEGMPGDATRSAKAKWLADRYVAASQIAMRCRRLLDDVTASKGVLRDELIAVLAVPDEIAGYERDFLVRLTAAGVGQPDLHTGGRKLADAVAAFIKQYNSNRRGGGGQVGPDNYADVLPLSSWSELPRRFAGIELVDVAPGDEAGFGATPLPPFTDIAAFVEDGSRPPLAETRRATVSGWSGIIGAWCNRTGTTLAPMERAAWAILLAHYLSDDASNISNLNGQEMESPWAEGRVVRIVAPPPEKASPQGGSG